MGNELPRFSENTGIVVDVTWADNPLTYAALVAQVYRLQNEVAGLAAQVAEMREKVKAWEADS